MTTFTIITSSLNALPMLKLTAVSILQQTHSDWQWIVVDGSSGDGTPTWLHETSLAYPNVIFISEPDHGIYDAWNKALPLINGEWVIFLGAGDRLKAATTLQHCSHLLATVPASNSLAYGCVELIDSPQDESGELNDERWQGIAGRWGHGRPATPNHQGVFHRTTLFRSGKQFDATYHIAGDTAFILPELLENGGYAMEVTISLMLKGGVSGNIRNKILMLREILKVNRASGLAWKRVHYQYAAFFYHIIEVLSVVAVQRVRQQFSSKKVRDRFKE